MALMIRDILKLEIEKAIKTLYGDKGCPPARRTGGPWRIDFSVSADGKFGDYSSNAAMILAKELKSNPVEVADNLKSQILSATEGKARFFEKIEVAKLGFLNVTLSEKGLE